MDRPYPRQSSSTRIFGHTPDIHPCQPSILPHIPPIAFQKGPDMHTPDTLPKMIDTNHTPDTAQSLQPRLVPALWPGQWVRVMCDWSGSPCWNKDGAPESPFTLPISRALAVRMRAWFAWYDAQDPYLDSPHEIPDTGRAWFCAEGEAIATQLRAELGPDWTVVLYRHDLRHSPTEA